jgi:hypothetical protein
MMKYTSHSLIFDGVTKSLTARLQLTLTHVHIAVNSGTVSDPNHGFSSLSSKVVGIMTKLPIVTHDFINSLFSFYLEDM